MLFGKRMTLIIRASAVLTKAIRWYISYILSQLFHLKKYQEIKKSKNPSYLVLAYLPQRQWRNYTYANPARTIHPLSAPEQTDLTIKTVHNPQYFWNLQFDQKITNLNIRKFYDRTRSNILLFTLVAGVLFFINSWASVI